uniref:(California timema) hypothetical protein n=1 Tax=Timema californicum TaxID=61474 RepID=A0A7R9JH87_TIMCA|nr:unnamed protein product [Timema californicum]
MDRAVQAVGRGYSGRCECGGKIQGCLSKRYNNVCKLCDLQLPRGEIEIRLHPFLYNLPLFLRRKDNAHLALVVQKESLESLEAPDQ